MTDSLLDVASENFKLFLRARALVSNDHYVYRSTTETRISPIVNGQYKVWSTEYFPIDYLDYDVLVSQIKNNKASVENQGLADVNPAWTDAEKSLNFVIETYRERRPHWTSEFLAKLRSIAKEFLNESIYINVYSGANRGDHWNQKLVGSLRVIRERNKILPMERFLGIEIDCDGATKLEPGNFAIDKEHNEKIWPEIMMQLASSQVLKKAEGNQHHFLTYADIYSKSLYSRLGFTPVPPHRIKLHPGVEIKDGAIFKDGVEWTPMEASEEKIKRLLDLHIKRLKVRPSEAQTIELLESRRKHFGQAHLNFSNKISLPLETKFGKIRATMSTTRDLNNYMPSILVEKYVRGHWEPFESYDLDDIKFSSKLKPGFQEHATQYGPQNPVYYENGILYFDVNVGKTFGKFEVKISADLQQVISLKMQGHSEKTNKESNYFFQF